MSAPGPSRSPSSPPPPVVVLKAGREAPFLGRHPWVFSGAVARVPPGIDDGDEVEIRTADGGFVAAGLYNGRSQIRVRLYSWTEGRRLDRDFWRERIRAALELRRVLGLQGRGAGPPESAVRLVFSEGDGLSGLVVDRYGEWVTVLVTSLALHRRLDLLLDALEEEVGPAGFLLRTEKGVGEEEGLEVRDGLLRGEEPPGAITVVEGGLRFRVDARTGQKTGFYLDQRDNRRHMARYASGRAVADICCYTGAFALAALRAGAGSVVGVDVSKSALALARENAEANGLGQARFERGDAFRWLEHAAEEGMRFGMVILDPPRFARTRRGVPQALRGYGRLNELAVRVLEPGGVLVTCSCSGRVTRDDFIGVLAGVSARTGRTIQLVESLGQAPDHPVAVTCPESAYLKCLICRVE